MGFFANRIGVLATYVADRARYGLPECEGPLDREVLFILDGVGGFQFAPVMIRRALRRGESPIGTIWYRWQWGLVGEIFTDLMWLRHNRVMGAKLARKILAFRRAHRETRIHLIAFSGGAGIAVFACEALRRERVIETLILACPALSPEYNLASALRAPRRAYAWISRRDRYLLGLGTTILGTTDRRFGPAAGQVGFRLPAQLDDGAREAYARLREIHWTEHMKTDDHYGGHTGWVNERFLSKHLHPMLEGRPLTPSHSLSC